MLVDWIALGIFGLCVVVCGVIIWRTLPKLASIRTDAIPRHQQEARKQQILDQRLQVKLGKFEASIALFFKKSFGILGRGIFQLIQKLRVMEREYRHKVITQQAVDDPEAVRSRIATSLAEGQAALIAEDYIKAEQHFVDVVSLDTKNIDAYLGLADVALGKKDYPNAREALQFVLKLQQGSDAAYTRLGRLASSEGNLIEAEQDFMKSVNLNATTASAHYDLGGVEEKLGNLDKAQAAYEEAVKLESANPKYLDALLQFAISAKRKALAETTLERLREANPENQKLPDLADTVKAL